MANSGTSPNMMAVAAARRSTRISEPVRMSVTGQTKVGSPFSEITLTLAENCHGCVYPSRNEHLAGSWVTLDFPNQQSDMKMHPVRAQVRFVRPPQSARESYQVGVELESPANVWRVQSAPEDWLRFPVLLNGAPGNGRSTTPTNGSHALPRSPNSDTGAELATQTSSTDQPTHSFDRSLQQAADSAVASAVSSRLNAAVNQAITAIDKFSQASARQIEEQCALYQKRLIGSARDEFLHRLQADMAEAHERLQKQLELSLTEVQDSTQGAAKNATSEAHLILAQSVDFLKDTARDFQSQFATQLRDTTDRAAAELSAETVRFLDRQLSLLAKQAQSAIGEGAALLEARAAEARTQLDSAANTLLTDFPHKATAEIEQAAAEVRQNFVNSLTSASDEIRADWDTRRREWQNAVARSTEEHSEQFRQKLESILHSSVVAAISSVNDHSKALLNSLSRKADNS